MGLQILVFFFLPKTKASGSVAVIESGTGKATYHYCKVISLTVPDDNDNTRSG